MLCFFLGLVHLVLKLVQKYSLLFMDFGLISFKRKKVIYIRNVHLPSVHLRCMWTQEGYRENRVSTIEQWHYLVPSYCV